MGNSVKETADWLANPDNWIVKIISKVGRWEYRPKYDAWEFSVPIYRQDFTPTVSVQIKYPDKITFWNLLKAFFKRKKY